MFWIMLEAARSAAMVECIIPDGCAKSLYGSMRMIAVLEVEFGADITDCRCVNWALDDNLLGVGDLD
jgi:hypothetical protein